MTASFRLLAESVEFVQHVHHLLPEPAELVPVHHRQALEHFATGRGQPHALSPLVPWIRRSPHESRSVGTVDELHHGVVSQLQRFGKITDDRRIAARVTAHGKEQLVLCGRDAGLAGGLFRKPLEDAQCVSKPGQSLVFTV
jgi:hypothetical protein